MPDEFITVDVDKNDARPGLLITSLEIEKETYLYVTKVSRFAEHTMKGLVPEGETGNLKRAVKSDILATPFRQEGSSLFGGGGWQSRAYIDNKGLAFYTGRRAKPPGNFPQPPQDPPIEYALAVNDGRRALNAGYFNHGYAWYDPSRPAIRTTRYGKGSTKGYNVFKRYLKERAGVHFIEATDELTTQYAHEQVQQFMRRKGRSTLNSRVADQIELGVYRGNPSNFPV